MTFFSFLQKMTAGEKAGSKAGAKVAKANS
jgi:hypothetical protein